MFPDINQAQGHDGSDSYKQQVSPNRFNGHDTYVYYMTETNC